ncbi:MAG: multidrug ABC transporter ATP-binding protein, partial [Lachnospiraceae bacterium]|nr:multidrug ABC transporter ATP-binding protein [Lachnospiraceae bacterium]
MPEQKDEKIAERNIPGMMNRGQRFAEVQHAENAAAALRRIAIYFAKEKVMVSCMLAVVIFGTLCGVYAPSLQSKAIDIIAKTKTGNLVMTLILMTSIYLLYSGGQLLQGLISAKLSQRIVKRMREELFDKLMDLPIRYLDTHSHGDVMSRMTNDIENISTTVSQSLPSFYSNVIKIIVTISI